VVHMRFGAQSPAGNSGPDAGFHAIAVHPGDIGMPEPPTSTLALGSLFGLWLATRRGTR
jgi:hypothetical protein